MEPGKAWLRQPVAKVIARSRAKRTYRSGDQGAHRGHQCSETLLKGEPSSIVSVSTSLGRKLLPP
jgi:hypothetical protein